MPNVYHRLSPAELIEVIPLRSLLISLPENFIPPGVLDPNYIPPYRGNELLITTIVLMSIVYPIATVRFVVQHRSSGIKMDDWLMFVAVIGYTIITILNFVAIYIGGFGYHSYDLNFYHCDVSFAMIQCITLIYTLNLGIIRLSLLCLIRRIFCKANDTLRRITDTVIAVVIAFMIANEAIYIFECTPIIANFRIKPRLTATCHPPALRLYIMSSLNIALDVVILALPAKSIWHLKSSLKDRIRLLILFWMGAFACMCAMFRLVAIGRVTETQDVDYDSIPVLIWGGMEQSSAIIISCLPCLNTRIIKVFSQHFACYRSRKVDGSHATATNHTTASITPINSATRTSQYPHLDDAEFESDETYEDYLKQQKKTSPC